MDFVFSFMNFEVVLVSWIYKMGCQYIQNVKELKTMSYGNSVSDFAQMKFLKWNFYLVKKDILHTLKTDFLICTQLYGITKNHCMNNQ